MTIKIKFSFFEGGGVLGQREKSPKTLFFFRGKRHDNKILKLQILLSRNFVVIAQAPKVGQKPGKIGQRKNSARTGGFRPFSEAGKGSHPHIFGLSKKIGPQLALRRVILWQNRQGGVL